VMTSFWQQPFSAGQSAGVRPAGGQLPAGVLTWAPAAAAAAAPQHQQQQQQGVAQQQPMLAASYALQQQGSGSLGQPGTPGQPNPALVAAAAAAAAQRVQVRPQPLGAQPAPTGFSMAGVGGQQQVFMMQPLQLAPFAAAGALRPQAVPGYAPAGPPAPAGVEGLGPGAPPPAAQGQAGMVMLAAGQVGPGVTPALPSTAAVMGAGP
jgi:hypothetical protein